MRGIVLRRALIRSGAALLMAVAVTSTSGCAVAGRVLLAADALATVDDIIDVPADRSGEATSAAAIVDGTGGSGLWIREEPGGRGFTVLAEGFRVGWSCRRDGPRVDGPRGATTTWALVTTSDGETGFASAAYLLGEANVGTLPMCPP